MGLSCGGTVHGFIFELGETAIAAELAVVEAVADDRAAAIATLLDGEDADSELAIIENELIGSLGSPALDRRVAVDALGTLAEGTPTLRTYGDETIKTQAYAGYQAAKSARLSKPFAAPRPMLAVDGG